MRTRSCHCPADDPYAEGDKENDFQSGSRQLLLEISCKFSSLPWTGTWCPEAWLGSMEQEEFDGRKSLTCCSGSWSRSAKEPALRLLDGSRRAGDGARHGCWALLRASRVHPESIHQSRCPPTTVRDAAAKPADENIPVATYILLHRLVILLLLRGPPAAPAANFALPVCVCGTVSQIMSTRLAN